MLAQLRQGLQASFHLLRLVGISRADTGFELDEAGGFPVDEATAFLALPPPQRP